MDTTLIGFFILSICLIAGLALTASKNHDVSYFPYFGLTIVSIWLALDINIVMLSFGLAILAIFGFLMALDSLNVINKD